MRVATQQTPTAVFQPQAAIEPFHISTPYLALGDVDKFAEPNDSHVTATEALLALRIAVGLGIPPDMLEHQEFRLEIMRWFMHQQVQNALGLIDVLVYGRRSRFRSPAPIPI